MKYFTRVNPVFLGVLLFASAMRMYALNANLPYAFYHDELNYIESTLKLGAGPFMLEGLSHGGLFYLLLLPLFACYFILGKLIGLFGSSLEFYYSFLKDPSIIILMARSVVAGCSVFMIVFVYKSAKLLSGESVAVTAAIFASASLLTAQLSSIGMADIVSVTILTLSFFWGLKSALENRARGIKISAMLVGFAAAAKYHCVFGAAFIVAFETYRYLPLGAMNRDGFISLSKEIILDGFICILAFLVGVPFILIDPVKLYQDTFVLLGNDYIAAHDFGHTVIFQLTHHLRNAFGLIYAPLIFIGVIFGVIARKKEYIFPAFFVIGFYLLISRSVGYCHHLAPLVPFAALIVSRLLYDFGSFFGKDRHGWLFPLLSVLVIFPTLKDSIVLTLIMPAPNTRILSKDWIEKNLPADAVVGLEGCAKEDCVMTSQILQNQVSLNRSLENVRSKGGSGKRYTAMLELLDPRHDPPRFDIHKYDTYIGSFDQIVRADPGYIILNGFYDLDIAELTEGNRPVDYFQNRAVLKEQIGRHYELIHEIRPTVQFTQYFPDVMIDPDYSLLRSLGFHDLKNFIGGPALQIYRKKSMS